MCVIRSDAWSARMLVAFGLLAVTSTPSVTGPLDNSRPSGPVTLLVKCQPAIGASGAVVGCKTKPATKNVFQQGQDRSGTNNRSGQSAGGSRSTGRSASPSSMGASSSPMGGTSSPMGN